MIKKRDTNIKRHAVSDRIYLIPIVLLIGYIPLTVRMVEFDPGLSLVPWGYEGNELDFFLIWKMRLMLAVSVIMLILLIYGVIKKRFRLRPYPVEFNILFIYMIFVFISGILSPWRKFAFTGTFDMFRTVPLLLSYVLMCIYSYFVLEDKEQILFVAKASGPGIFMMGLIGTLQTFGINIFNVYIIRLLMLPKDHRYYAEDMTVGDGVYATLFNPDYFAVYTGIIIPLTLVFALIIRDIFWRICFLICAVLLLISLIGTETDSVYISVLITAIIGLFIVISRTGKRRGIFLIGLGFLVIAGSIIILFIPSLSDRVETAFLGSEVYRESMRDPIIETSDDEIVFTYPDGRLIRISYDAASSSEGLISVSDRTGAPLSLVPYEDDDTDGYLMIDDDDCELTVFRLEEYDKYGHYLSMIMAGKEYDFTNSADNTYYYITPGLWETVRITQPEKYQVFPDAFMSGRGWIWNYSLPMLKDNILTGIGSNTFIFEFPHNYAHYADDDEFDARPHSMYLQQWIENGFIAFLLLGIFYASYFVRSLKLFRSSDMKAYTDRIALALFLAITCYMISGLVNDAMMFISPFIWILTGAGIRLCRTKSLTDH